MTKAQHTPGPWAYRDHGIYSETAKPDWAHLDEDFADERVCVVSLLGAMGGADSAADARLIAAAPELLACLQYVLDADLYDGALTMGTAALSPAIRDKVKRTIAAATGVKED